MCMHKNTVTCANVLAKDTTNDRQAMLKMQNIHFTDTQCPGGVSITERESCAKRIL